MAATDTCQIRKYPNEEEKVVPFVERVYIRNAGTRTLLAKWISVEGLNWTEYKAFVDQLHENYSNLLKLVVIAHLYQTKAKEEFLKKKKIKDTQCYMGIFRPLL